MPPACTPRDLLTLVSMTLQIIGVVLAILSGVFIGSSFVFKKKGLLSMQSKPGFVAGEGHAYLRSPMWWTGMSLMIIGEICNCERRLAQDRLMNELKLGWSNFQSLHMLSQVRWSQLSRVRRSP